MLQHDRDSRDAPQLLAALFALAGALLLLATVAASIGLASAPGEALTRNTIRLSLGWYALALFFLLAMRPRDWTAATARHRCARWCWTWGMLCLLVHVASAFHYYDDWSHARAFERTRQVSGVGEGLYVSYLFSGLWAADVIWWWAWPRQYAARSVWIDRSLHAFMLLMVFNSTVVFETGLTRWLGLALFAALGAGWMWRSRTAYRPSGISGSTTWASIDSDSCHPR
jgi:hypothetical protein